MAKAKLLQEIKTVGLRFKVLMSFEWTRRRLPKSKVGILVAGEEFTILEEGWFTVSELNRHLEKGYIKLLPAKKRKKGKKS